jgi:REP-associated tyrosine transposase
MPDWPHAPIHRFSDSGIYFITAGTHLKQHIFRDPHALDALQAAVFMQAEKHDCHLQAWSLLSNHYHLVVASDDGSRVREMLTRLHVETAIEVNQSQGAQGRKVWFQFWDTQLTFEPSWLARLKYTHENAVHHGLVRNAEEYRWCSASWFASIARRSFVETVRRMKVDRLNVYDDFIP